MFISKIIGLVTFIFLVLDSDLFIFNQCVLQHANSPPLTNKIIRPAFNDLQRWPSTNTCAQNKRIVKSISQIFLPKELFFRQIKFSSDNGKIMKKNLEDFFFNSVEIFEANIIMILENSN